MNSKLLKVCAAVMLVAGAGDGVCDPSNSSLGSKDGVVPRRQIVNKPETDISIEAKVKVLVNVEFDNNVQTLSLIGDDGQEETDENKCVYKFKINSLACGYGLKFESSDHQTEDGLIVMKSDDGCELKIDSILFDGENKQIAASFIGNIVPFDTKKQSTGEWKLKLRAMLQDDVCEGTYKGKIKISVVAAG